MISAVVLAAGPSRRFGRPKQLLKIGDRTMLQHSIQRVLESNVQEVIVVLGYAAEEIMPVISSAGIKVLTNPHYNRGLSESRKVGLRAVSPDSSGALIYLADQPLVSPRTIDKLIETFKATRALAVVPTYRGERGNPVVLALAFL